jgi:ubiquinol-cytochrome c reductase subunit 6
MKRPSGARTTPTWPENTVLDLSAVLLHHPSTMTLYAESPQEQNIQHAESQEEPPAGPEAEVEAEAEAEAEEEDPEDVRFLLFLHAFFIHSHILNLQIHPTLREEAQESSKCKAAAQHFFHCQEKVLSGKGFKHEDCVEEM